MSAVQDVKKFGCGRLKVWDVTLTVDAEETTASAVSPDYFAGRVIKVELDPGTVKANATLKGYEANTPLATDKRDHFLNYTSASYAELAFYPVIDGSKGIGGADPTTKLSQPPVVCDQLRLDLAGADPANSIRVRVYVEA